MILQLFHTQIINFKQIQRKFEKTINFQNGDPTKKNMLAKDFI